MLPDTMLPSASTVSYSIEVTDTSMSGELASIRSLYDGGDGWFTFRANTLRNADFGGKVTGSPTKVVKDWQFDTYFDATKTSMGTWGGGTGWTGQPLYLRHTGFQFSFCAVLAIGILLPALPGRILKALAIPLATLPVYLWAYGTFPVTSLLLNLIVIPLMTVVMVSAGGAVLLAGIIGCLFGGMTDSLAACGPLPARESRAIFC